MDFGSDVGLLSPPSNTTTATAFASSSDPETKQKWYGSGFFKQERSKSSSLFSDGQQQMLSFSSPNLQPVTLPYYHQTASPYTRNTGYSSGGLNAANMHGMVTGVRGPFTPSQWMELEHQALIYKYITANSPVPSNLLNPIRKAVESAGFSCFPGAHLRPNTLGWGAFHLGFSNTDPEQGRCRRTDGKKWRCSRDAVSDQKYCERHVNRGRHRSRKPVEGQAAHSVSGTTNTAAKLLPMSSSTSAASVAPARGTSNSPEASLHQLNNLQHGAPNPSASPHLSRSYMNKANVGEKIQEQQNPYQEPSRTEFGLVYSDSLLNHPFQKSYSLINCRSYDSSDDLNDRQNKSQHSLLQFMDEWPKNQSESAAMSWPDIDMQSDRTQLSISIPVAASDFLSSNSSPTNEKLALSPLRLSIELDSTQMGLGTDAIFNESNQRQANWIPISWENTMGGPLGEVLHSTNNIASCKNTPALNLMTEGWDNSPRLAASPTGVLQKTTFRSLSNSSTGSSPRTENNLLGTNLIGTSFPAL